ncbi:MAG: PilN domain-containing protein [Candidatus Edwardsbacteria bacterium]|jgi:Tfp pilus assembly protein PilN|nr:PilN domain-containing protein [Candidatus Edwardsbacteria bacterium]
MLQINLIRDRKIAKVAAPKGAAGGGFQLRLPQIPGLHLGLVLSTAALLIVLVVVIVLFTTQKAQIGQLQGKITQYNEELAKLAGPKRMVDEFLAKQADLNTKLSEINSIDKGRYKLVQLMDGLSQSLVDNVWLTSFNEDGSTLKIDCLTFSNLIVADFMMKMKATGYFTSVELSQTEKTTVEGREVVKFSLTCGINPNPPDSLTTNQAATAGRAQQ